MKMKDLQIDTHIGGGLVASAIYSHVHHDGSNTHIASRLLREFCLTANPPLEKFWVPIEGHYVKLMVEQNAVDMKRVMALRPQDRFEPILYCKDGEFTNGRPDVFLVDGHHRYVRAAIDHEPFILSWCLELEQWLPYKIEDAPSISREELVAVDPSHPLIRNYWQKEKDE